MAKNKQQIKFDADVSQFKTKIKESEKSITSLNNELKLNQAQLKGNSSDSNLLSQRIEILKQKYEEQTKVVENTRKSYEKAVETFGENSKQAENLKNKLLQTETAQQNIKNEINKTNQHLTVQTDKLLITGKAWQESGKTLKDYGSKIESVGNKLSIVSGIVGGIAVASLKASIDFETAFAGVIKTVNGTEQQLAELRQGILDMSTELPSSASQISAVAESAGQLGIQTENILDFTRVMIDLGNSTNVAAEEGATALAKFANITKMSADKYSNLGSTIVALGNNYATTEADIISMGQNLASAGTQVGMSQSDIMALATALSSVGLEAQAGGTAFSKALVEMQLAVETNSKDLKDWADVAGISTKEFSRLFKDDATSALQAFIKGLSECGGETESAIKILDDMGITETRMRDALLRSANASDTFTSAIELGSKAWNDNIALTEEAEKRYETTESQIEMLKNEAIKTAIEFGDELAPSLRQIVKDSKPMLNSISSAVKAFADLDDKTKKNIITIGAYVVALGPAIKISGNVIKTIGSVRTGIGTLTEAIGLAKNGIGDATGAAATLAKTLKTITSPTGLAIAAIVGVTTAVTTLALKENEAQKVSREFAEEIKSSKNALDEYNSSIDETKNKELSYINAVERLKNELSTLVDENGKVKKGYESRVDFILNEMNEALGTEYELNENLIDGYKELQQEIDKLIEKKRAEIILAADEEKWKNAIENEESAIDKLTSAYSNLQDLQEKEGMTLDELKAKAQEYYDKSESLIHGKGFAGKMWKKNADEIQNVIDAYEDALSEVQTYTGDSENYEKNYGLFVEGNYSEISNTVKTSTKDWTSSSLDTIKKSIDETAISLQSYKQLYEVTGNEVLLTRQQQAQQELTALAEGLIAQTSIVNLNSPNVVEAWKQLANNSYSVYYDSISKLDPTLREEIEKATGVIAEKTPELEEETGKMATSVLNEFKNNSEYRKSALDNLEGLLQGLEDEELRQLLKDAGIENADEVIKGIKEGNLAEDEGEKILSSLQAGLENKTWRDSLWSTARGIASTLSGLLTVKANVNGNTSNLPGHKTGLDYVPYDNYVARLHKGERVLTAEENKEYMADNIENKVFSRNIVVQFFPQSMTEVELQRAETYIAKKWGMAL